MPRRLPEEYVDRVDKERWGQEFDVNDEEHHTAKIVTGYILYRLKLYQSEEFDDYKLWTWFREDFQDWTKEIFALGENDDVRKLRDHLRAYGVYVPRDGKRIAENLAIVAKANEYHDWTEEQANEELKFNKAFHSQWNPTTDKYRIPTLLHTSHPPMQQTQRNQSNRNLYPNLPQPTSQPDPHRQNNNFPVPLNLSFNPVPNSPQSNPPENFYRPNTFGETAQSQEPSDASKKITDLMKIYGKDEKFGGEMYDIIGHQTTNLLRLLRKGWSIKYSIPYCLLSHAQRTSGHILLRSTFE